MAAHVPADGRPAHTTPGLGDSAPPPHHVVAATPTLGGGRLQRPVQASETLPADGGHDQPGMERELPVPPIPIPICGRPALACPHGHHHHTAAAPNTSACMTACVSSNGTPPSPAFQTESHSPVISGATLSQRSSACMQDSAGPGDTHHCTPRDNLPPELTRMYALRGTLGDGSFAKVRLAVHILSDTKVAIKVLLLGFVFPI